MKIKDKPKFREELLNCPNCGAPITGDRCEYCGTQFIDCTVKKDKPFYLKVSVDGNRTIIVKVLLESLTVEFEPYDLCYGDIDGKSFIRTGSGAHRFNASYVMCD